MPRLASGDEKPPMSAEARRWWLAPSDARVVGGRSELEPSGVLLRLAAMLDMAAVGCSCSGEVWLKFEILRDVCQSREDTDFGGKECNAYKIEYHVVCSFSRVRVLRSPAVRLASKESRVAMGQGTG
jgi:hypothetical protein